MTPPADDEATREAEVLDRIARFRARRGRFRDQVITLAHGAGGKASASLIDGVFLEAFGASPAAGGQPDAARLVPAPGHELAFTTDSFVVNPRRFPGGSIGHLAVHGTVNDLAVEGARPRWLSASFVLEEGLEVDELRAVVADMADAAQRSGVEIVTGDTKVVERGAADGLYITTAGVGEVVGDLRLGADRVRAGDVVLISGSIAAHGMAVLLARGDLAIDADIASDTASVAGVVERVLEAAPGTRWLRDPTRGGVATVCNELAHDAGLGVVLDEEDLPVDPAVEGACDLLGIDPLYVANEGKVVAVVPREQADDAVAAMQSVPEGREATRIGEIVADPTDVVVLRTGFGSTRIVDMLVGDPLPRIC